MIINKCKYILCDIISSVYHCLNKFNQNIDKKKLVFINTKHKLLPFNILNIKIISK